MNAINRIKAVWAALTQRPDPGPRTPQVPVLRAGMHVDHDRALTYSALFAAVRVIAETVAILPWSVHRRTGGSHREIATAHPTHYVLHRAPNPEMTPFSFKETMLAWALTWGNGYAEIERDRVGRVVALWPIPPDTCEPRRDREGRLYYRIYNQRGGAVELDPSDVFHLHGLGYDGLQGYSVVSLMAKSIGLGLATEEYGSSFYANGATPNTALKHPGKLSEDAYEHLKESLSEHTGPGKAFKTMILEEGMSWASLGMPHHDAQFLETRKFQVTDIARWLRVPPHMIGDLERATFSNIEHQSQSFVSNAILPWTVRLEEEADRKLFGQNPRGTLYSKINVNALLRGDTTARGDFYIKMLEHGVYSVNDVRELEDQDPIGPDGDKRLVQLNMTTLEKIGVDDEEKDDPTDPTDSESPDEPDGLPNPEQGQQDSGNPPV